MAWWTIGVHFIFGAFLFGAIMPRAGAAALRHEILVRLEQITVLLLLPVFFLTAGLEVDLGQFGGRQLLELGLVLAVAIGGKFAGAYLGATLTGVPRWQASALGTLMNTRGSTELVILSVGLEAGLIGSELFSILVVMALVTTIMTGPLLRRVYPERRVVRDIAAAERAAKGIHRGFTVLVVASGDAEDRSQLALALALVAAERPAEIVLSAIQPFPRSRLEVGSGLTDELASMTQLRPWTTWKRPHSEPARPVWNSPC